MATTCEAWPVEWPCDVEGKTPEQLDAAAEFAGFMLWGLSGRRIGTCVYEESYWPASTGACGVGKDRAGNWRNAMVGADCCRILLAHTPVLSVEAVTLDGGEPLDAATYDVVRQAWLRSRDGCWPTSWSCDDPPVAVSYTAGFPFPPGTPLAVGEVACELLKGWSGEPCKLPARAISVSRQGVTVQLADPAEFVENGLLGLPVADAWIRAVNPNKLQMASRVYSPDLAQRR
jgi:hypothetical protein